METPFPADTSSMQEARIKLYVEQMLAERPVLSEAEKNVARVRHYNQRLRSLEIHWYFETGLEDMSYLSSLRKSDLLRISKGKKIDGKWAVTLTRGFLRKHVNITDELLHETLYCSRWRPQQFGFLVRVLRRDFAFSFQKEKTRTAPVSKRIKRLFRATFSIHVSERFRRQVFDSIHRYCRSNIAFRVWRSVLKRL